jgi:hypothetical protein
MSTGAHVYAPVEQILDDAELPAALTILCRGAIFLPSFFLPSFLPSFLLPSVLPRLLSLAQESS